MENLRPRSSHGGVPLRYPTVVELNQQLGNLQAQLTGSEDALDREKRRTQRIRAERDDLRREVGQMNQKIQQQACSIDELKKKNTEQARELHEQSIKLDKQKKTIKVQSDTISGKQHTSDRGPFMTPAHKNTQRNLTEDTPTASAAAARRVRTHELPPPPFPLSRSEPKASYGPPLPSQQISFTQALVPYGETAPSRMQRETSSIPSGLVPHQNTASTDIDYMASLQYIFSLTESWARNYANSPNASRDSKLSNSFMETLTALAGPNVPLSLLSNMHTRHFVIASYINRYLVKKIFTTEALNGFNNDADHKLQVTRVHLVDNTPLHTRVAVLHSMAKTVNMMKVARGFKEFLKGRARGRGDRLFGELRLTMHEGANVEAAWRELVELMTVGHELTVGMYSMPFEFSFTFPPAGAVFDPSCMVSHDPAVKGDPLALQRGGAKVRVGVSPVSVKWELESAANVPQTVHYAKVLLRA